MSARPRRLLTIGRSYAVLLNRRLAHEMSRQGRGRWEVTAAAPSFVNAHLRPVSFEPTPGEPCGVEVLPVHLSFWIHTMLYGRSLRRLLDRSWDLVHCWEEPYVLAAMQIARLVPKKVPFVFLTHQNIDKRYPPPFSWAERYCLERCAGWEGGGVEIVSNALGRGYGRKPHRMVPLGVDMDAFYPSPSARAEMRRALGFAENGPPVVGFLGRFVPEKGPLALTRVLDRVTTPWRALFVGEGALEETLHRWAADRADRVRIVTGVRHSQVPAYLNTMDVLCAPSRTTPRWREQFGKMIVEAFACGVPVIGSDSGEIPHVVREAGLIASENDENAWARALSDLLENPARRRELSEKGLERVRTHYAWPVVARTHLDFFDELLGTGLA